MNLTPTEIIKSLRCCQFDSNDSCFNCPMSSYESDRHQACYKVLKGLAADLIEQYYERSAIQNECRTWINVEIALPKCNGENGMSDDVLMLDINDVQHIGYYDFIHRQWIPDDDPDGFVNVRCWMPLPEVPEDL